MARISKDEFVKSLLALEEANSACLANQNDTHLFKLFRDASIQRFEFCVELAWKVAIKSLGQPVTSPKPALREMFKSGLISDIDLWFDFIEARNKSSHTYDENIAKEVFAFISKFILAAKDLETRI